MITIQACGNADNPRAVTPDSELKASSCLEDLNLQKLGRALEHCNAVVMSHTGNPVPLIDRSLLLTLMGRDDAACDDVTKAASLLKQGDRSTDRLLEHELEVRQQSCRHRATMTGNG
jgi:hypothetical protein